jgi:hypothetical protein
VERTAKTLARFTRRSPLALGARGIEQRTMAVPYETIRAEVERLCNYVTHDLDRLIGQDVGGNYLAAALITCACDAISYLKYGQRNRGDLFFTEILPDLWKPLAKTLYDAIRNGIVHTYETKTIILGSKHLDIGISWRVKPHLHLSARGTEVYVNVSQLSQDLKVAVAQFEADLKVDANLRDTFFKSMRSEREINPANSERQKWQQVLSQTPQEAI